MASGNCDDQSEGDCAVRAFMSSFLRGPVFLRCWTTDNVDRRKLRRTTRAFTTAPSFVGSMQIGRRNLYPKHLAHNAKSVFNRSCQRKSVS